MVYSSGELQEGLDIEHALQIVLSACSNFMPEHLIRPHLDELRTLLSDPITAQQAHALTFVALKRCDIKDAVSWLRDSSEGWLSYIDRKRWPLSDEELEELNKRMRKQIRQEVIMEYGLDKLRQGISIERAFELFLGACNKSDTLFITEGWIQPYLAELRRLLSAPITADQAEALLDCVFKEMRTQRSVELARRVSYSLASLYRRKTLAG